MPPLLLGLLLSTHPLTQGAGACGTCHQPIVASFVQTAHFRTSAEGTARSVKGPFSEGHNLLRTGSPGVYFKMERRGDALYQTGIDSGLGGATTERIDLVVGSGRRGQSYLFWKGGLLFELPVSYLTGPGQWINSPGYQDGQLDFGRLVVPRCLECHATSFTLYPDRGRLRYSRDYALGISCEKCHGEGRAHTRYQASHPAEVAAKYILNLARLPRDRQVDVCALCHSGERDPKQPPFSYRPGAKLDDYLMPPSTGDVPIPDVHGNQVGLLQRSKCFRASPGMSCATCHDVHRAERDVTLLAQKCLACHQTSGHPLADRIGDRLLTACVDCHMPNRKSNAIQINTATRRVALSYRSHAIGIYPDVAAMVLRSPGATEHR